MVDAVEDCKLSAQLGLARCVSFIPQTTRTAIDSHDESTDKSDENRHLILGFVYCRKGVYVCHLTIKRISKHGAKSILPEANVDGSTVNLLCAPSPAGNTVVMVRRKLH